MKRKVCIITRILTPESWKIKDREMEEAIRLNLKPEDIYLTISNHKTNDSSLGTTFL